MSDCETCGRPLVDHAAAAMRRSHARLLAALEGWIAVERTHGSMSDTCLLCAAVTEARTALFEARQITTQEGR